MLLISSNLVLKSKHKIILGRVFNSFFIYFFIITFHFFVSIRIILFCHVYSDLVPWFNAAQFFSPCHILVLTH